MDLMMPTTSSAMLHNCQAMNERINANSCCGSSQSVQISNRKNTCCVDGVCADSEFLGSKMFRKNTNYCCNNCITTDCVNYCRNSTLSPLETKTTVTRLKRSLATFTKTPPALTTTTSSTSSSSTTTASKSSRRLLSVKEENNSRLPTLSRRASSTIFVLVVSHIFNAVCARPNVNGYGASPIGQLPAKSPQKGIQEINPILRHRYSSKFQERLKTLHDALSTMHYANKNRLLRFANANGTSRTLALSDGVSTMKNGSYRTRNCFFSPIQCQLPYVAPQTHRMADLRANAAESGASSGGLAMARSKVISDRNSNEKSIGYQKVEQERQSIRHAPVTVAYEANEAGDAGDDDDEMIVRASSSVAPEKRKSYEPSGSRGVRAISASALNERNKAGGVALRRTLKRKESARQRSARAELSTHDLAKWRALLAPPAAEPSMKRRQRDSRRRTRTPSIILIALDD